MSESGETEVHLPESIPQHGDGESEGNLECSGRVESGTAEPEQRIPSTSHKPSLEEEVEESCQKSSTSQEEDSSKSNPKDGDEVGDSPSEGRGFLMCSGEVGCYRRRYAKRS